MIPYAFSAWAPHDSSSAAGFGFACRPQMSPAKKKHRRVTAVQGLARAGAGLGFGVEFDMT